VLGQVSYNETDAREQFARMPFDLRDYASRPPPRFGLILKAMIKDLRLVRGTTDRSSQQMLDFPLQDRIGLEARRLPTCLERIQASGPSLHPNNDKPRPTTVAAGRGRMSTPARPRHRLTPSGHLLEFGTYRRHTTYAPLADLLRRIVIRDDSNCRHCVQSCERVNRARKAPAGVLCSGFIKGMSWERVSPMM